MSFNFNLKRKFFLKIRKIFCLFIVLNYHGQEIFINIFFALNFMVSYLSQIFVEAFIVLNC